MRLSKKTLILVAATAVLAVACADTTVVATVDDAYIDESSVTQLRYSYADAAAYDAEGFRADLTNLIYLEAQKSAAEQDFGLTGFDDPERIEAKIADPTEDDAQVFASVQTDLDRTDETTAAVAEQLLIREAVVAELVSDEVDLADIYENQPALLVSVCARHILVATSEEAEAVKARLDAGEDFAEVANEVSLDTNSVGGELPCPVAAADYVEEFSSASAILPLGEISTPVATQFGWHILVVDDRTGPDSFEAFVADPTAYLHASVLSELWVPWVNNAIQSATIEVASQVGTWTYASNGIVPPPAG
ncbi:MAG: peptidylprolyl isomerase [Acidimicrobiia bacterium]